MVIIIVIMDWDSVIVVYEITADDVVRSVVLNLAEKKVGSILLSDVAITGTTEGIEDGALDGKIDKSSKEANDPPSSSSVIPMEPAVGMDVGIGTGAPVVGRKVVGATVTGALVTGAMVTGASVTGAFVMGALVEIGTDIGAGVEGMTMGGDVDGGVVVVVVPPFGSLPKPETRNVILSNDDEKVKSVIVIPVDTIFPF